MCPSVPPDVDRAIEALQLPDQFSGPLAVYVTKLICQLAPYCIILYGSLARGTYTTASDIDLVVIARQLPANVLDRLGSLQDLNDTPRAIDAFGYTPDEFDSMLRRGHLTALEAVADGVPLYGARYFGALRTFYQDMVNRGLRRSHCSWIMPNPPGTDVGPGD